MGESITYRNITYRLLPGDVAAAERLLGTWDACRYVWNEVKAAREFQYAYWGDHTLESPTFFTFGKAFKVLWDHTDWLREYSYHILRYTLKYQADAWRAFFKGDSEYPKWKSRYGTPSITIPDNVRIKASVRLTGTGICRRSMGLALTSLCLSAPTKAGAFTQTLSLPAGWRRRAPPAPRPSVSATIHPAVRASHPS